MEKIHHVNRRHKKVWVAILRYEKIDFKTKNIAKDKEGCITIIKWSRSDISKMVE